MKLIVYGIEDENVDLGISKTLSGDNINFIVSSLAFPSTEWEYSLFYGGKDFWIKTGGISHISVRENGIVIQYDGSVNLNYKEYDPEPVTSRLYIFDDGEVVKISIQDPERDIDRGMETPQVMALEEKLGKPIELRSTKNTPIEKITNKNKKKNEAIMRNCKVKLELMLTELKKAIGMEESLNPESEEYKKRKEAFDQKIIYLVVDYLNKEAKSWSVERMLRETKYKFAFLGDDLTEDLLKTSIYIHLGKYKQIAKEQKKQELEEEKEIKRRIS